MLRARLSLAAVVLSVVGLVACGGSEDVERAAADTSSTSTSTSSTVEVRTDVLADLVDPPGAEGRTLSLVRYTIAPGAKLSPHIHPGVQMAHIDSGTLTYTVVSGTALVQRAGSTERSEVTGPATIELVAGESVIEIDDMVHFGENLSAEPVVIVSTLLTLDGHDLAEKVTTTTTAPPG